MEELLIAAGRELDADLGRILVAGHSNGGFMALRLALEKPGRIGAVALAAATLTPELAACVSVQSPVSALFVHGSHDTVIPAQGGRQPGGVRLLPVEEAFALWAQRTGCSAEEPAEETPNACGLPVLRRIRSDPSRGARVGLLQVQGGGHEWPAVWGGEGLLPPEQSAAAGKALSEEIWSFFKG